MELGSRSNLRILWIEGLFCAICGFLLFKRSLADKREGFKGTNEIPRVAHPGSFVFLPFHSCPSWSAFPLAVALR
jgi:hypothetical protein